MAVEGDVVLWFSFFFFFILVFSLLRDREERVNGLVMSGVKVSEREWKERET